MFPLVRTQLSHVSFSCRYNNPAQVMLPSNMGSTSHHLVLHENLSVDSVKDTLWKQVPDLWQGHKRQDFYLCLSKSKVGIHIHIHIILFKCYNSIYVHVTLHYPATFTFTTHTPHIILMFTHTHSIYQYSSSTKKKKRNNSNPISRSCLVSMQ